MRLLYISNHDMRAHNGVVYKIKAQVQEWSKQNHEIYIFSSVGFKVFDSSFNEIYSYPLLWKLLSRTGPFRFIVIHFCTLLAANRLNPNLIYSRYFLFSPFLVVLASLYPFIIEVNGNDQVELRNSKPFLYVYNELTRDLTFLSTRGLSFVSFELKELFSKYQKPSLVIANGVHPFEVDRNNILDDVVKSPRVNIGFSGTANQSWHGLDKILPLFHKNKDIHLHVVGATGVPTENITYYGRVDSKMNQKILNSCSVCISTLALHRTNINEASPLKSREYVLLGKRMIYAYDDRDMDSVASTYPDLFLKISNDNCNVASNEEVILKFLRLNPNILFYQSIRDLGLQKMTYSKKELQRLRFFDAISKS